MLPTEAKFSRQNRRLGQRREERPTPRPAEFSSDTADSDITLRLSSCSRGNSDSNGVRRRRRADPCATR